MCYDTYENGERYPKYIANEFIAHEVMNGDKEHETKFRILRLQVQLCKL